MAPLIRLTIRLLFCYPFAVLGSEPGVDYQRDVRRILSRHCYECHGPDQEARKAELRLDIPEGAIEELGGKAISRTHPGESLILERILSRDPEVRMPPLEENRVLSAAERDMLVRWVESGAPWDEHWAYVPPVRPSVPSEFGGELGANPIDQFIGRRLRQRSIEWSEAASPATLVRRLSFDLVGLPPRPDEVEAFTDDPSPVAYDRLVDRLLASPHYGERMAMYWFDLVRFANTTGVHADNVWHVTPYRNWVIEAFNANMPFDRFTREQLAGDLLPKATTKSRIAATYNRLNLSTREGGSQAKEFLAKYMADRVRNASSVWLATTLGCAECHDHKFDPISTKEFYEFGAFFADIDQVGVYGSDFPPYLRLPTSDQTRSLDNVDQAIGAAKARIEASTPELAAAQEAWETRTIELLDADPTWADWWSLGPFVSESFEEAVKTKFGPEEELDLEREYADGNLGWLRQADWIDGEIHTLTGEHATYYFYREVEASHDRKLTMWFGSSGGVRVWFNGKRVLNRERRRTVEKDQDKVDVELEKGSNTLLIKVSLGHPEGGVYFRSKSELVPESIRELLLASDSEKDESSVERLRKYFRSKTPLLADEREALTGLEKQRTELEKGVERTLATVSVKPMVTRVLPRGNWMDESGARVYPGFPMALGGEEASDDQTRNRLDLANWIVDRGNPMTARVFVNRLWMLFFGAGLSPSVDDFGMQGEVPSHLELLDWLAVEFMESGWDIKHVVRLIVSSKVYQQSSDRRTPLEQADPFNRNFARQNRYRLDAEMVRDMALSSSGLLNRQVAGRSVSHPYQPQGYYRHLNFPKRTYKSDDGEDQFRRGVYVHWQRQFLHPALKAFDAPTREECVAQRSRSNTPLAALVQMNDPSIIEAARALAERVLRSEASGVEERIRWGYRQVLSRSPSAEEGDILAAFFEEQRASFSEDESALMSFLSIGLNEVPKDLDRVELAAWTMVARTLFNLHESILRP